MIEISYYNACSLRMCFELERRLHRARPQDQEIMITQMYSCLDTKYIFFFILAICAALAIFCLLKCCKCCLVACLSVA